MHELSIASTIVDTVLREIEQRDLKVVYSISLKIGELTAVVPEALQFGFSVLIKDTQLAHTQLLIETIPITGRCRVCGVSFAVEQFIFVCPECGSGEIETIRGDELDIVSIKAEE